nr:hypothetical protein BaRGS_003001 [Batillaria attramentaria]
MVKEVANTAARLILEELVTGIMDGIAKGDTLLPPERSIKGHSCSDAVAPSAEEACEDASVEGGIDFPAEASGQSSYMAEYSKFIASYIRESDKIGAQLTSKELRGLAVSCSDQSSDSQSASGATMHNKDTMTANPEKTEVAMATEMVECLDTSMLATAEMSSKTTMTDSEGRCNAHTSMTPLKALAKHGHRLTSDDVRKQHPRTLANQLETLNVCNSRLESELKSAQQEQSQLKSALKHAKASEAGARKELAALELEKEREWAEKESHYQEKVSELGQLAAERVGFILALELEVSEMREALEAATTRHAKEVADLEAKCQAIEEHRFQAAQQYEQELEELRRDQETNTYRRQFELAQQLVREREAELVELRAVFVDLQDTAQRQEQVNDAFQGIHDKVLALARENKQLKEALHKQEERGRQQVHVSALEEENKSLVQEADSLKHTMELNNGTLSEVIQLNSELFGARKAMQELLLTKEGLAKRANELQDELDVVRQEHAALSETLTQAQEQLEQQTKTCEDLQKLNTRIKKMYEEKFENLELGIENLQRTLDNRELDIDTLEKDLYECRNIIVEQRYKIDGLESELREVREEAAKKQSNDDDVQFFKESNALLEAERSLYVDSLRDLEEKLKKASLEVGRQQQMAADAQCLVTQLEREKNRLQSQLAQTQNQLSQSSHALATFEAEHAQVESVAVAAAVILEDEVDRSRAEIDVSRQESNKLESTISQLQAGNRQMAERLMALTDHKFEVKRLSGEVKRLEGEVDAQCREKEVLAGELETLLRRLETSSSSDGSTVQARCVRDIIALKKKNQNLLTQLADQKDHYEELGRKAARRMRVLEENWKKAEDEVYRFDELVENIRRLSVHRKRMDGR